MSDYSKLFLSPQWLKEYHTKYPHGLSVMENLIEWVNQVNELIDYVNISPDKILEVLTQWRDDGTLKNIIDEILLSSKADKTDLEARSFNVINYGVIGDNVTDNSAALNVLSAMVGSSGGGTIFFPKGDYFISSAIHLLSHTKVIGQKGTKIKAATSGFTFQEDARSCTIEDLQLIGINTTYPVGSKALAFNEDNGGWLNTIKNVEIWNFEYGIFARDIWWHNVVENVLCHNNKHGLYVVYKSIGSAINNTFINFYVDKPKDWPIMLSSARRMVFINPSIDTTTFHGGLKADLNCDVTIIGGNFEGSDLPAGQSVITLGMHSRLSATGFNVSTFSVISGTAYVLNCDGEYSSATLNDCRFVKVPNLRQIRTAQKTGIKIVNNSPLIDDYYNATGDSAPGGQYKNNNAALSSFSQPLSLSGGAKDLPLLYSSFPHRIKTAKIFYNEASDSNPGINVELFYTADTGYDQIVATLTTLPNQIKGSLQDFNITYYALRADRPLRVRTSGNKTGAGQVTAVLEYMNE